MNGMLTIKLYVLLPTTKPRPKWVTLAKTWCAHDEAKATLGKWAELNDSIPMYHVRAEWIAHESVFDGSFDLEAQDDRLSVMRDAIAPRKSN